MKNDVLKVLVYDMPDAARHINEQLCAIQLLTGMKLDVKLATSISAAYQWLTCVDAAIIYGGSEGRRLIEMAREIGVRTFESLHTASGSDPVIVCSDVQTAATDALSLSALSSIKA